MVDILYRTLGPWGSGKGANLQPSEVDNNFFNLAEAIVALETNPAQPVGIASITVSGTQMYITLTDSTVLGPYTIPVLTFRWRGVWEPDADYIALDVVTVEFTGIFMCQVAHTSPPAFDIGQEIGGTLVWLQLFGSVDASLTGLSDVQVTALADGQYLYWLGEPTNKWVNISVGSMAYQDSDAVTITGGRITGMPSPTVPSEVVTKGYVDALPGGATAFTGAMLANITSGPAPAIENTLSNYLDFVLGTTITGTLLYRSASGWEALDPGVPGTFLQTHGGGIDPTWEVGASGVTMVMPGTGITTGATAITTSGTVSLANIPTGNLLSNISGGSAAPVPHTLSIFLDSVLTTTRGALLTRTGVGWQALLPGSFGLFLKSTGSGADLVWDSPAGAGTVTSINAGTGISTGGAPITATGTVSLAAVADKTLLANISGASAAPAPATLSTLFDAILGTTRGMLLYRSGTGWQALNAGTSGQLLSTGGTTADPSWINAPSGAPIANLQLLANLSGSTAVATGQSISAILDATISSARGTLLFRGSAGWTALAPGTSGNLLQTGGAAGDPSWVVPPSSGASLTISDTAPASPAAGAMWWCSADGQLYVYYVDPSGSPGQWVPATNQAVSGGSSSVAWTDITGKPSTFPPTVPIAESNVTNLVTDLAAKAPLASPVFTGTPSLPTGTTGVTQAVGTNNTSIATTAFVRTQGYQTTNATITLSGAVSGSGTTAITTTLATVPIGSGGTNATTAAAALTNLGAVAKAGDTMTGTLTVNGGDITLYQPGGSDYLHFYDDGNSHIEANTQLSLNSNGRTVSIGGQTIMSSSIVNTNAGQATANIDTTAPTNMYVCDNGTGFGNGGSILFCASGASWRFAAIKGYATNASGNSQGDVYISTRRLDTDPTLTATASFSYNGSCYNISGSWAQFSDRSLKQDVEPYLRGLDDLIKLQPVQFRYRAGTLFTTVDEPSKLLYGLIADEVLPHIPEVCDTTEIHVDDDIEGETETVATLNPTDLIYALVNSVKTLAEQNEQLSTRIATLESAQ